MQQAEPGAQVWHPHEAAESVVPGLAPEACAMALNLRQERMCGPAYGASDHGHLLGHADACGPGPADAAQAQRASAREEDEGGAQAAPGAQLPTA